MKNTLRSADTDIMRIICSFCVVLLHTATCNRVTTDLSAEISGTINSLCRFSVPVFVMISGKYMISKECSIASIFKKCLKLFLEMIMVSFVYMIFDYCVWGVAPKDIRTVAEILLTSPIHLWYIYTIIIVYLFTPLLKIFSQNATRKELIYIIILCFFFGSILYIPLKTNNGFSVLKDVVEKCHIEPIFAFVGCYMLGYYISKFSLSIKSKFLIYLLGVLGVMASIFIQNLSVFSEEIKYLSLSFFAPNVVIQSISFYVFMTDILNGTLIKEHKESKFKKIIELFSKSTRFVYLWHILILSFVTKCNLGVINISYVCIVSLIVYNICVCINTFLMSLANYVKHICNIKHF